MFYAGILTCIVCITITFSLDRISTAVERISNTTASTVERISIHSIDKLTASVDQLTRTFEAFSTSIGSNGTYSFTPLKGSKFEIHT